MHDIMRQTAAMENLFASCKLSQNKSTAQNKNQKDVVDHQINLCHTGIVLQAFCNRTNTNISELVAPLHHKSLLAPPALVSLGTLNHNHALFTGSCRISPTSHTPSTSHPFRILRHAPTYHFDLFQALESTKIRTQRLDIVIPQLLC